MEVKLKVKVKGKVKSKGKGTGKGKGNVIPVHPMKTYRGSRSICPLILEEGT